MHVFVKETLYLLDYNDNMLEMLFSSTDKRTAGYAYEINIQEHNTGHSDLNFRMPCDIIDKDGEKIKNPKLALIKPLSKVRYNRQITYMGEEPIDVPIGGDRVETYPKNNGANPEDYIMEDYTMDYIIQPLDKSRQNIGIGLAYTAIDFPRFNLSKKKVGLTFNTKTVVEPELSLYKNKPLSVPGKVQYIRWGNELAKSYQSVGQVAYVENLSSQNAQPGDTYYVNSNGMLYIKQENGEWVAVNGEDNSLTTWYPNPQNGKYPLDENAIKKLVKETDFSYGILSTIYYWPITESGRFEGVYYEKGGFITLSLYNTYEGSDWEGSDYLNSVTWEWGFLEPIKPYLSPNNACNYLRYILKDTNWKVKGNKEHFISKSETQPWFNYGEKPDTGSNGDYFISIKDKESFVYRMVEGAWVDETEKTFGYIVNRDKNDSDFGTLYDVDIEQVEVSRTKEASIGGRIMTDARYNLQVNNANCYNAITAEAKLFDLYPVFDCINKTVTLKLNVGKDYGLTYRFKSNLKSSNVKVDGEKVITKLYVTGGRDVQGSRNINIGESTRSIVGTAPILNAPQAENYNPNELNSQITSLEKNAYEHINGVQLASGIDMTKQTFKIELPDNLYELKYTVAQLEGTNKFEENIYTFSSGHKIDLLYNPTTKDHCLYVYLNKGSNSYKDEKNQIYKFDFGNMTLRRNLEEIKFENIGTVSSINTGNVTRTGIPIANYIKYRPTLDPSIYKDENFFKGNVTKQFNEGEYVLDISKGEEIVLTGPDRVYTIKTGEEGNYNYSVGNYYFKQKDNTYLYCIKDNTDSGSIYNKINTISINGYVFVVLGTPEDPLIINLDGDGDGWINLPLTVKTKNLIKDTLYDQHIIAQEGKNLLMTSKNGTNYVLYNDGTKVTLKDWFSNNFALRVGYFNGDLKEVDNFNPNNPEYLMKRSPYGETYIYNFKYLYDNNWITKEQILDIYRVNALINNLNLDFYNKYTKDLVNTRAKLKDAINNQEIYSAKADAQLEALMSQYWKNPNKATDGQFSAFPGMPKFDTGSVESHYDNNKKMYWEQITYDVSDGQGKITTVPVKKVYFNVFNTAPCNELYPSSRDNKTVDQNPEGEGQYHVVAKALGWDANRTGVLTLNKPLGHYTNAQDPSKTAESYNKFVEQMKEYYYRAMKAEEAVEEATLDMKKLEERYKEWETKIQDYEKYLQENYGQYIIEGSYNNEEQPYANLLFEDGLEASDKYAVPDITYGVNVVDASGLIEYRAPQLHLCNRLVKRLHSIGQIAPHVGDYVSIQDEPMGMFGVPGLITSISRRIDNPYQNQITVDTSYSDADELVGNIITATNTVLSNKDIYGRAAIINNKGELSTTTVSNALSTGKNSINIVSTNGKVEVNDNGLTCLNPYNQSFAIRYNGTGILSSTDAGKSWKELMNPNGINANYINAGTINSSKVSITDGGHDVTILNGDGLAIKETPNKPYTLGSLNSDGVVDEFKNLTVFVGRDKNGEGVGYFNGYINATKGGNIGGWKIKSDRLTSENDSILLSPRGVDGYVFKAGNNFKVDTNGKLYAKGALIDGDSVFKGSGEFTGDIHANSLTLNKDIKIKEGNLILTDTHALIAANDVAIKANTANIKANKASIDANTLSIQANSTNINSNSVNINSHNTRISSLETTITGKVSYYALKTAGSTVINGANITTGTVSADRIDVSGIFAKDVTATGTISGAHLNGASLSVGNLKIDPGVQHTVRDVSGNMVTFNTPIEIGGGSTNSIAVYGNPGGASYEGWHVGATAHMEFMMNTINQGWLYIVKGLVVGWGNNKK